jgi:hypothetical protein
VVYLDRGPGRFAVTVNGTKLLLQQLGDSGRWKTAERAIEHAAFSRDGGVAPIVIESDGDVTLHMMEVARDR